MAANTKYTIRCNIFFDTAATPDFKYAMTGPASPTMVRTVRRTIDPSAQTTESVAVDTAATGSVSVASGTGTTGGHVTMETIWQNGSNAANWTFQWAQNTSDASNTTVLAGSYCEYGVN
jgi:hypothetical protein